MNAAQKILNHIGGTAAFIAQEGYTQARKFQKQEVKEQRDGRKAARKERLEAYSFARNLRQWARMVYTRN